MEKQQLGSTSRQCSSPPVGFGQGFLSKTKWQHRRIPHTLLTWLQLIFTCSLEWNQHWTEGAFVIVLKLLNTRRKNCKGFTKWLSEIFPKQLQPLAKLHSCTRELFWRKSRWNDCTVYYFSEIKRFPEHFETITHMKVIPTLVTKINIINWKFSQTCTSRKLRYSSALVLVTRRGPPWAIVHSRSRRIDVTSKHLSV